MHNSSALVSHRVATGSTAMLHLHVSRNNQPNAGVREGLSCDIEVKAAVGSPTRLDRRGEGRRIQVVAATSPLDAT